MSRTRLTKACSICLEKFTKECYPIECYHCRNTTVCTVCAQSFIDITMTVFGCSVCKKEWDTEFIRYLFGDVLAEKCIKVDKQKILEQDKTLIPKTQPLANYIKLKRDRKTEIQTLHKIRSSLLERVYELNTEIDINTEAIHSAKPLNTQIDAITYVMACPQSECKGFVSSTSTPSDTQPAVTSGRTHKELAVFIVKWECEVCHTLVCQDCHHSITMGRKHVCKKSDIASVKLIKSDTKQCPVCMVSIQKLQGCSQMFCTKCMTGFNWETLKVTTGTIHNPHYYDALNAGLITPGRATGPGGTPGVCGNIPDFSHIVDVSLALDNASYLIFREYHRRIGEIEDYISDCTHIKPLAQLLTDHRVKYMLGEYTSDEYTDAIYTQHTFNKKAIIEHDILRTFLVMVSERFNDMMLTYDEIMQTRIVTTMADGSERQRLIPLKKRKKMIKEHTQTRFSEITNIFTLVDEYLETNGLNLITPNTHTPGIGALNNRHRGENTTEDDGYHGFRYIELVKWYRYGDGYSDTSDYSDLDNSYSSNSFSSDDEE